MTIDSEDNADLKRHLLNIESRLDRVATFLYGGSDVLPNNRDNEIDLREVWDILWKGRWWIVGITFFFSTLAVVLALSLPNRYKAEVVLAPAQEQSGAMGGLAAQYGGLAAMAGINLGQGQSSDIDQAIVLVKSWPFLHEFVEKYDLKPMVFAVKGWDSVNDRAIFNEDIYDPGTKRWVQKSGPNKSAEPTSYEVYESLIKMLTVNDDAKTGLIRLEVEHYVPKVSREWAELLVKELNYYFQSRDIKEANQNITYLRDKINETSIAEMQSVFYRMIEAQMKTLMLAEVSGEYLVKSVVKPRLPERKSRPKRALVSIAGVFLGCVVGIVFVLLLHLRNREN